MCFKPTKEEVERNEARRAVIGEPDRRRDPSSYPEPRGNQERDEQEVAKSREKLEAVLGQ